MTRTPNFTVRTSEKEAELVQASLDRLPAAARTATLS